MQYQQHSEKTFKPIVAETNTDYYDSGFVKPLLAAHVHLTSTESIVKAVNQGTNCVKKVNVSNIKDKCKDLKNVLHNRLMLWGSFLSPISNT